MISFKQFRDKTTTKKKKPLDYAAVRAASSVSKPLQKVSKHTTILHREDNITEDGMGGGAVAAGPTNVVGGGAIAGSGGKGGEPGVDMKKRRKSPVMFNVGRRKSPKM